MTRQEFFAKWEHEAEVLLRREALINGATLCEELLRDVRELLAEESERLLSLSEAAKASGYSADHLGRLVRSGTIPNAGRPNAPRLRYGDLPRKPAQVAKRGPQPYHPDTDARTLLSRQRGERHG